MEHWLCIHANTVDTIIPPTIYPNLPPPSKVKSELKKNAKD